VVLYAHICAKIEVRIQNQRPCMRTSQVEQVNVRNMFLHGSCQICECAHTDCMRTCASACRTACGPQWTHVAVVARASRLYAHFHVRM
jgi:hypothetical protein